MTTGVTLKQFDDWLDDGSEVAALTMRQWLEPVEGKDAVIFPPTYATPKGMKDSEWGGYNIDTFSDGTSICQIDSVGSQANRMEPLFKRETYKQLVPDVTVKTNEMEEISLLDAGHRAADAVVRFSEIGPRLHAAFVAFQKQGDAEPLAKIAPTSFVFGAWDSRATQVKLPRIVRSVIRAYSVRPPLHRSAQYTTIAGEILTGGDAEVKTEGPEAELGLAHVPAGWSHGGILAEEIRRDAALNLVALRSLMGAKGNDTKEETAEKHPLALRRYLLGLSLVSLTAPQNGFLREGCQLVGGSRPTEWKKVYYDGTREDVTISHETALTYAGQAASAFGVGDVLQGKFDSELAKEVMKLPKESRKVFLRKGPPTGKRLDELKKKVKQKEKGTVSTPSDATALSSDEAKRE